MKAQPINFDYEHIEMPDDCIFKISPSQIGLFFKNPSLWYRQEVLKERTFKGDTATVLGTICHYIFENAVKDLEIDTEEIDELLDMYAINNIELNLDTQHIKTSYRAIAPVVINELGLYSMKGASAELKLIAPVKDGIYVGGTSDLFVSNTAKDFKTVSKKPSEGKITKDHYQQLMAYVYAGKHMGHELYRIEIDYGIAPTKTIPARCQRNVQDIDPEDDKYIHDVLNLIADTVLLAKEKPELAYLLFKDYRLKEKNYGWN